MLRRGHLRLNRRNIGGGPRFSPADIAGLDVWFRSDLGITEKAADTKSDFTGWSPTLVTLSTTQATDSNDASPQIHYAQWSPAGAEANVYGTLEVELKAGTKNIVRIQWGSIPLAGAHFAYVNLTTGAVGSTGGGTVSATTTDMGDGWWKLTLKGTNNAYSVFIVIADSDSGVGAGSTGNNTDVTYQGDGTGTVYARNWSTTHHRVSTWANQAATGSSRNVTQATAGKQPQHLPTQVNGNPSLYFLTSRVDTLVSGNFQHGHATDITAFVVKKNADPATAYIHLAKGVGAGAGGGGGYQLSHSNGNQVIGGLVDTTSLTEYTYKSAVGAASANWELIEMVGDAAQARDDEISLFRNGKSYGSPTDVGSAGTVDDINANTPLHIGARNNNYPITGHIAEVIVYARKLTWGERVRVEQYLAKRYGLTMPSSFEDSFNGWAARYDAALGVTETGGKVSAWADQSGLGRHQLQGTEAYQPTYNSSGGPNDLPYIEHGVDAWMKASFTLTQPVSAYIVGKKGVPDQANPTFLDGNTGNTMRLYHAGVAPGSDVQTGMTSNGSNVIYSSAITATNWNRIRAVFNGASGAIQYNGGTTVTGNVGSGVAGGITLSRFGTSGGEAAYSFTHAWFFSRLLTALEDSWIQAEIAARTGL